MRIHELKIWPAEFAAVDDDEKTAEFRKDDRGIEVGDHIRLLEYDPEIPMPKEHDPDKIDDLKLTGRKSLVLITHINRAPEFGIPEGFIVLSIRRVR